MVRRLTDTADLEKYHGILSDETAEELEEVVREQREARNEERARRREGIVDEYEG